MLTLPIKKKWFDMIISGEKTEEYRERSEYYNKRFENLFYSTFGDEPKEIILRNGYSKKSPAIKIKCTRVIGTGFPEWGAEKGKIYNVIKIHEWEWIKE